MFKLIWNWLVLSSNDPAKYAMTVKGVLLGIIPTVLVLTKLANVDLGQEALTQTVDTIAMVVQVGLGIVASALFLVGLVRKIWLTLTGQNKVLNQ